MPSMTLQQFLDLSVAERTTLKELEIRGTLQAEEGSIGELDRAQLQQFTNALQECQQLRQLNLSRNSLDALNTAGLMLLGNALQRCPQLQSLNLSMNTLGDLDAARLTILGNAILGCSQLQSLDIELNHLRKLDAHCLTFLGNALRSCPKLQSVNLSSNSLAERAPALVDSILLNPNVFMIKSPNLSVVQRQTLKKHYLSSISKKAFQYTHPLLQPWKNGCNLPSELLLAVLEFEKTEGLLIPDYPVSEAEINAAFDKGIKRAEMMRKDKATVEPASSTLTFSSTAPSSTSSAKKRRQRAEHAVPSNTKKRRTKQAEPLGSVIVRGREGIEIRKSCRLLNKKRKR